MDMDIITICLLVCGLLYVCGYLSEGIKFKDTKKKD